MLRFKFVLDDLYSFLCLYKQVLDVMNVNRGCPYCDSLLFNFFQLPLRLAAARQVQKEAKHFITAGRIGFLILVQSPHGGHEQ